MHHSRTRDPISEFIKSLLEFPKKNTIKLDEFPSLFQQMFSIK